MIVVKVELHSAITGKVTTLGVGKISNDGGGSESLGNYDVTLLDKAGRVWKRTQVRDFPRLRLLGWDLVYRALHNALMERNP